MPYIDIFNPLLEDVLRVYRNPDSSSYECYTSIKACSTLLAAEVAKYMGYEKRKIKTLTREEDSLVLDRKVCFIPKIRSGLVMLDPFIDVFHVSTTAHLLIERKDKKDSISYFKLRAEYASYKKIILDPIIGTGNTINLIIDKLCEFEDLSETIMVASIMCSPRGAMNILDKYPMVKVFAGVKTEVLDSNPGVFPRIGDFGDRVF